MLEAFNAPQPVRQLKNNYETYFADTNYSDEDKGLLTSIVRENKKGTLTIHWGEDREKTIDTAKLASEENFADELIMKIEDFILTLPAEETKGDREPTFSFEERIIH